MKTREIISMASGLIVIALYMSAFSVYGNIPSKRRVQEKVAQTVESEEYQLDRVEKTNKKPREKVYYFKSKERDLEFTAKSTLIKEDYLLFITYYEKGVFVYYAEAVRNLYQDEAAKILKASPYFDRVYDENYYDIPEYYLHIENYEELRQVAKTMYEIEELYSAERQYNSDAWVAENPLLSIWVMWDTEDEQIERPSPSPSTIERFYITGLEEENAIWQELQSEYVRRIKKGEIPEDKTVPDSIMNRTEDESDEKDIDNK